MKVFLQRFVEVKVAACKLFTASVVLYLYFSALFGSREVPVLALWGLLLVSLAGAVIQAVCFTDWIIKKMRYTRRTLLFLLLFYPTLSFAAWKMGWFPVQDARAWAVFTGSFFLIFLAMTAGFDLYFQITGRKYDGLIGQYRRQKEEEEKKN